MGLQQRAKCNLNIKTMSFDAKMMIVLLISIQTLKISVNIKYTYLSKGLLVFSLI